MNNERDKVYLAALLHDIGKFYQRADTGSIKSSRYLKNCRNLESVFCPNRNGVYTHKHALWTAAFFEDNRSVFQQLVNENIDDFRQSDNLVILSAAHHLTHPEGSLGQIIKIADSLSSGMDRESESAYTDEQDEQSWDAFKKKRMTSILETINAKSGDIMKYVIPTEAMRCDKSTFAAPKESFSDAPDYDALWQKFVGEFKFIQSDTYRAFSETLLNLMYKYTTTIPSSTINFPDVSLYDHSKTTAAIAVCLYDILKSGEKTDDEFLLVGGDFSGIQSYIHQIVSKRASKNLKGRSFYIRLLSDVIVRFLLHKLDLYQANIVYNSGGSFYILAPNTEYTRQQLNEAICTLEQHIFDELSTQLYIAIDSVSFSRQELLNGGYNGRNIADIWTELFDRRNRRKNAKYADMIQTNYGAFFVPFGKGLIYDAYTGEEIVDNRFSIIDGVKIKESTRQQIKLGETLRSARYMVVSDQEIPYWDIEPIKPLNLGYYYYFASEKIFAEYEQRLRASADHVNVVTFNGNNGNCDFINGIHGINNIYSLEFYGGNEMGLDSRIPTFEQMCTGYNDDEVFTRMGVLQMDVDNLGSIFQSGIIPERLSLSRMAALSRSFDFFFSGYINTIWRNIAPRNTYIIYSGGDDMLIVGDWSKVILLAKEIRQQFADYTCHNSSFSISGGMSIVETKYPIIRAIDDSADEEHNAKQHKCKSLSKNAFSFMNTPLNWRYEYPVVEQLKNQLVNLIVNDHLPKSFINKVLAHAENAEIIDGRITNYRTYWMMTYDLGRMKSRTTPETQNIIDNCKNEVCGNLPLLNGTDIATGYHPLQLWAFACRWAELEYRTTKNINNQ